MPSPVELIINFENPSVDVKVCRNQLGKLVIKVFLIIDIMSTDWHGNVCLLKDPLGT